MLVMMGAASAGGNTMDSAGMPSMAAPKPLKPRIVPAASMARPAKARAQGWAVSVAAVEDSSKEFYRAQVLSRSMANGAQDWRVGMISSRLMLMWSGRVAT